MFIDKITEICYHFHQSLLRSEYQKAAYHYKISDYGKKEMIEIFREYYKSLLQSGNDIDTVEIRKYRHVHPHLDSLIYNLEVKYLDPIIPKNMEINGCDLLERIEPLPDGHITPCGICNSMLYWFVNLTDEIVPDFLLEHNEPGKCPKCKTKWLMIGNTIRYY